MSTVRFLPSPEEIEQQRRQLAMAPELREELTELVASSCRRPDSHYMGQQIRDPVLDLEFRVVSTVLKWAYGRGPQAPANTTDQPIVSGSEVVGRPLTIDDSRVQLGSGLVSGVAIGAVPLGSTGAEVAIQLRLLPNGTYWAQVGKACGEIIVGTTQIVLGCTGVAGGAGVSGTGGGAVVGIPLMAESLLIAANGCVTLGHGIAHAAQLLDEGPPKECSTPASEPTLLKPKPPAAAPPPPKAAAPTKPAQTQPTFPPETRTTTHNKATGVTTSKTKSGTTSTTRPRAKEKPPGDATNGVAKGAKRGPKTDPDAPHNAARKKDAEKLKAEGNKIIAGGGEKKEKLVKTPGGIKSGRRPDTIIETPAGKRQGRNYGRTKADGTPIKREQEALDDLNKYGDTPTDFVPYDR